MTREPVSRAVLDNIAKLRAELPETVTAIEALRPTDYDLGDHVTLNGTLYRIVAITSHPADEAEAEAFGCGPGDPITGIELVPVTAPPNRDQP